MNTLVSFNVDQLVVNRNLRNRGTNGVRKLLLDKVRDILKLFQLFSKLLTKAAVRRCFTEKLFLKGLQNSQENVSAGVTFLIKLIKEQAFRFVTLKKIL